MPAESHDLSYIRERVSQACDTCKQRKVKCDGHLPCSYCKRRQRGPACRFTAPAVRRPRGRRTTTPKSLRTSASSTPAPAPAAATVPSPVIHHHHRHHHSNNGSSSDNITAPATPLLHPHPPPLPRVAPPPPRHPTPTPTPTPNAAVSPVLTRYGDVASSSTEEAEVPRDARLLCDKQGRLVFIGDCAPLSLFQTVRQIVTSRVDPNAFEPGSSSQLQLENVTAEQLAPVGQQQQRRQQQQQPQQHQPRGDQQQARHHQHQQSSTSIGSDIDTNPSNIRRFVRTYLTVTSALVDLFGDGHDDEDAETKLAEEITSWAAAAAAKNNNNDKNQNIIIDDDDDDPWSSEAAQSAVYYLVLAVGSQSEDEQVAAAYFLRGKGLALGGLSGNLSILTVQCFLLTTLYMLRSCQINGAFLFFGIAARAAYAIGLHRTELNDRFGSATHIRRDRLWKSVRILDLYLSISTGRPPAASDADCTVSYRSLVVEDKNSGSGSTERYDLLNASIQILIIVEEIVRQVYSRRKISLQLAEGISRQLREWSGRWLVALHETINTYTNTNTNNNNNTSSSSSSSSSSSGDHDHASASHASKKRNHDARDITGACQVLLSYYYAVMLVSRPFLMYELCRRLPETATAPPESISDGGSGRSKLANACIDAATLMIGLVLDLVEQESIVDRRMPLIVSWLFASSLVVGVGLLGGFGRALEKHARASVMALDYFGRDDAHAAQYARIAESLRLCALDYLARRDVEDRRRIAEESTQLFGLMPRNHHSSSAHQEQRHHHQSTTGSGGGSAGAGAGVGAGRGLFSEMMRMTSPNGGPNAEYNSNDTSQQQQHRQQDQQSQQPMQQLWESDAFGDFDPSIFSFSDALSSSTSQNDFRAGPGGAHGNYDSADQVFGGLNLFPLLEGNGHIDLAHLL